MQVKYIKKVRLIKSDSINLFKKINYSITQNLLKVVDYVSSNV